MSSSSPRVAGYLISLDIRLEVMGKGRDKRRRKTKHKDEVRIPRGEPLSGESLGPFDPYASVPTPLKPRPSLRSGAIALPKPDVPDDSVLDAIGVRLSNWPLPH